MKNKICSSKLKANQITILKQPESKSDVTNKEYVECFIERGELNKKTIVRNNVDNDFNNKNILNVNSFEKSNDKFNDNNVVNKKYTDSLKLIRYEEESVEYVRVNILDNDYYLKVYQEDSLIDVTTYIVTNMGSDLLPKRSLNSQNMSGVDAKNAFFRSSNYSTPTPFSGMSYHVDGMYIETSNTNFGDGNFCSMERTDSHVSR